MKREIENIPLFDGVDPDRLGKLACYFHACKYEAGQELMTAGKCGDDVFFLMRGKVRLSLLSAEGDVISYREILPCDYFGWLAALDHNERLTGAIALEPSEVLAVNAAQFREIVLADPQISENFMRRMAETLRRYTQRIRELTLLPARARIICELARRFDGKANIDIGSHEDFATWTGTTRETVTRTLAALEQEGFIAKDGTVYRLLRAFEELQGWLSE